MTGHGPPDAADGNALAPPRSNGVARVAQRPRATPRGGGEFMARPRAGAAPPYHHRRRYLAAHSPPPTAPFSPVCDTPGAAAAHRHAADAHLHRGAHGRKPAGTRARPSPLAPSPAPSPAPVPTRTLAPSWSPSPLPSRPLALTLPLSSTRSGGRRRLGGRLQHLGRRRGEHGAPGGGASRAAA